MKRGILIVIGVFMFSALVWAGTFYWQHLRGVGPVLKQPPADIVELLEEQETTPPHSSPSKGEEGNGTDFPLTILDGFEISVLASGFEKPRMMTIGPRGNLWMSEMRAGTIVMIDFANDNAVSRPVRELHNPHGLAFDPEDPFVLYIAEEDRISKVRTYSEGQLELVRELPGGGGHFTRTIHFGPDGRLYVSIGSTCNVCYEDDPQRAAIYSMNRDGSDYRLFASGLRNTVDFVWSDADGRMWGVDNGRDLLGDALPPDELNIIEEGVNYGWPVCYGNNIHDTVFDQNTYIRTPCSEPFERGSHVDLPAHIAPLGLDFIPEEGWPEDLWYDLIIGYHGSWNSSVPVGYKLARIKLDEAGNYLGQEDFISGWLTDEGALGRPVDVLTQPGGIMYVSDDKAGVIYRIVYTGPLN